MIKQSGAKMDVKFYALTSYLNESFFQIPFIDNFHWNYAKRDSFFTKVTKSRYIKDKVDALSKEKAQLKEQVHVDWVITSGAEVTATSEIATIILRMMKTCLLVFNIWSSNEYDDLSASYYDAVNHLKALSLNELNAEVTRVGNPIDEVEE